MLLIYLMQQRTVNNLLGCRDFIVSALMNGNTVLLGNLMFTMHLRFHANYGNNESFHINRILLVLFRIIVSYFI